MEPISIAIGAAAIFGAWTYLTASGGKAKAKASPQTTKPTSPLPPVGTTIPGFSTQPSNTPVSTPTQTSTPSYPTSDGVPVTQEKRSDLLASDRAPSSPNFQWYWVVTMGQSPALIARKITGKECDYLDLLDANPEKATTGPRVCYKINFNSLMPGETLKLPKSWNPYISVDGQRRGDRIPWSGK